MHVTDLTVTHDGTEVYLTAYGEIVTNNDLFDQDISVELQYYSVEVVPAGAFSVADSQSNTIHIKTNTSSSVWTGTQEQYDALSEYDVETLYVVVD